jgi:hypothetical protein
MTTSFNGTTGITFPDASTQSNSQVGMKNRIIDGGFTINQRGYVSGTSLASGTYGHDRWKGGASAGTYTFTQGALGVNTTITITAGSIIQVIEGCNLPEGGTYVLSWTGTAQGRLNGGTYGSSGTVTVTGWVAGTNLNVEFNTGTLGSVQLVAGSAVSSYSYRPYGTELALCQRYCPVYYIEQGNIVGMAISTTAVSIGIPISQPRTVPTGITSVGSWNTNTSAAQDAATLAFNAYGGGFYVSASIGTARFGANNAVMVSATTGSKIIFNGCEL